MRRTARLGLVLALLLAVAPAALGRRPHKPAHHHRAAVPHLITQRTWLSGVQVTEYYAVPEAWFVGRRVAAPGLHDAHRVDWLYSAAGLAIEGDGIDLKGQPVHVATTDTHGYIDTSGHRTSTAPAWVFGGYWLNAMHALTVPLEAGGWSAGTGVRYRHPPSGLTFAPGPSRPLTPYRSLAVDPRLIPLGSRVYIPAYNGVDGASGWFIAEDTGGGIRGRHVDVYRPAPRAPGDARMLTAQRILVEPPGSAPAPSGGGTAVPASLSCALTHMEASCPKS